MFYPGHLQLNPASLQRITRTRDNKNMYHTKAYLVKLADSKVKLERNTAEAWYCISIISAVNYSGWAKRHSSWGRNSLTACMILLSCISPCRNICKSGVTQALSDAVGCPGKNNLQVLQVHVCKILTQKILQVFARLFVTGSWKTYLLGTSEKIQLKIFIMFIRLNIYAHLDKATLLWSFTPKASFPGRYGWLHQTNRCA